MERYIVIGMAVFFMILGFVVEPGAVTRNIIASTVGIILVAVCILDVQAARRMEELKKILREELKK